MQNKLNEILDMSRREKITVALSDLNMPFDNNNLTAVCLLVALRKGFTVGILETIVMAVENAENNGLFVGNETDRRKAYTAISEISELLERLTFVQKLLLEEIKNE